MRIIVEKIRHSGYFFLFIIFSLNSIGQTASVNGIVKDADTKQPLPYVSVYIKNGKGITTDSTGHFLVEADQPFKQLVISSIGYTSQTVNVNPGSNKEVVIFLQPNSGSLKNVTVNTKTKVKYRNKDNPAVELIRRVIANKDKNRPQSYDYVQYEQYEKLQLSLSKLSPKITNSRFLKRYSFLFQNADTSKVPGKSLVPVYLEEKFSNNYYRKNPEKTKTVIIGDKKVNFGDLVDSKGLSTYLNRLYENVDIYQNDIPVFTNLFLSPIADLAPTFYFFYIRDTITDASGSKLIKMYFTPRNTNAFLFRGDMYITLDSNYAVQKINMFVSRDINLNWIRDLHVNQEFEKNDVDTRYHLVKSDVMAEAGITKGKDNGVFGERSVSFKNYKINQPHESSFYEGPPQVTLVDAGQHQDSFWVTHRFDSLSTAESKVYKNIDSLRSMPSFKRFMNISSFLLAGYKSFGKFETGPAAAFYGFNPIEGLKLRFGGRTTPQLSKRIYFETYAAYGFKDERWKGYLGITYSLNNKSIYQFPLNYIRASAQYDTDIPGQESQFVQEDNVLLSFKRGDNTKWLYNRIYKLDYVHEFSNNFSYTLGFKNWSQEPAGSITYTKQQDSNPVNVTNLTTSELSLALRWAPHEQFYQGKVYRISIINKYPIFHFRYVQGIKGLANGEYNYKNLNVAVEKRVYLSQFGYSDVLLEGGYILGQLPYPLLTIPRANQTYAYQIYSYNLMNFLEFVTDHYAAINIDQNFNGFIFNRIPLIKKLNLREYVAAKVLYGGLRSENDPNKHPSLYQFPTDVNGMPTTFSLNKTPYIEGSVGVGNIFKLVRVDLVKRFTYLNHPDIPKWGIRARVGFNF